MIREITKLYDKRDTFPFSVVCMPHSDSDISSVIYYASKGSEILRLARTISHINTFATRSNSYLKRMQKQRSRQRSIISMLIKIFCQYFTVFKVFIDTTTNFIKIFNCLELELYTCTFTCCSLILMFVLFVLLLFWFVFLFVFLFVWLSCYYRGCSSLIFLCIST